MSEAKKEPERVDALHSARGLLPRPLEQEHLWVEGKEEPADEFLPSVVKPRASTRRTRAAWPEHVLLVVEDEADDFVLLDRALRKTEGQASVRWAQSAGEALSLLEQLERHAKTICVVADLRLPGLDGFDLLQRIKGRNSPARLRFVFLTGRPDRTTEIRARASGADAFFVKPADCAQLIGIARELHALAI